MNYKGYCIMNFDHVADERYKTIIDNGTFLKHAGNWDYILYNNMVFYIALANIGCGSGLFSSYDYYRRNVA